MKLIPWLSIDGECVDGSYIKAIPFCKINCQKGVCLSFYQNLLNNKKCEFYTCPHGMSVYVNHDGAIFNCMREKRTYNKQLASRIKSQENIYNPVLDCKQLLDLIEISSVIDKEKREIDEKRASIDSISHEVKQLNAQIKDRSDIILQSYNLNEESATLSSEDVQKMREQIRTIFVSSSMIASRFSLYDYEKNPSTLSQGAVYPCVVYGKFDKIRKILKNYMKKNVVVNISGNSYAQITAYPSFEMIPFLIVENAIKYSYDKNGSVNINVKEQSGNKLNIVVDSYSPYCSETESQLIFTKGFRGKNAQRISDGSGVGLFFVKMLCDLHGITVHACSDSNKISEISGVPYAPFHLSLEFSNTFFEQ